MKKLFYCFAGLLFFTCVAEAQEIKSLRWGNDQKIYLTMASDSLIALPESVIFHSSDTVVKEQGFTFLPATLGSDYVNSVEHIGFQPDSLVSTPKITLWGTLHQSLGGGWPHMLNAIMRAIESQQLDLYAPMMLRPVSKWKPNPITESYKRTHTWKYYVPMEQKKAIKEYKIREKAGKLDDVNNLPESYRKLFLSTSQSKYNRLRKNGDYTTVAKIDIVKIFLGINYLGENQIKYISSRVQKATKGYRPSTLPQVLVLDPFEAAVMLEMNETGYKIKGIIFQNPETITEDEYFRRRARIEALINSINAQNQKAFEQRLKSLYP
jgi:hypothetical protein